MNDLPTKNSSTVLEQSFTSEFSDFADVHQGMRFCIGNVGAYWNANKLIYFLNVYSIPTIVAAGILCNVMNIVVLRGKHGRRLPSSSYLLNLSICDCLFLFFGALEVTPIHVDSLSASTDFNKFYTAAVLYIRMLASTFYKASVMLVIAFNIERYICVCHPLHAQRFCRKRNCRLVVAAVLFVALCLSAQWPLCYVRETCFNVLTNSTYYLIQISDNPYLVSYYKTLDYLNMVLFNAVPVVALFTLNFILIRTLRKIVVRDRKQSAASLGIVAKKRKASLFSFTRVSGANTILFAVVLMFLICVGPQIPARILFETYGPTNNLVLSYMAISQQFIFLNASLNFCLYCLVSKRYRSVMRKTLVSLCKFGQQHFEKSALTREKQHKCRVKIRTKMIQTEVNDENANLKFNGISQGDIESGDSKQLIESSENIALFPCEV